MLVSQIRGNDGSKSDDEEVLGRYDFLTASEYMDDLEQIMGALTRRVENAQAK